MVEVENDLQWLKLSFLSEITYDQARLQYVQEIKELKLASNTLFLGNL